MMQDDAQRTQRDMVGAIVGKIRHDSFGTGPLAELRRMDPRQGTPCQPTLHRLLARYVADERLHGDGMQRWSLLIHLLALAAPDGLRVSASLGRALFTAGYNEGRLTRLLEAPATDFPVLLPRMLRFVVAKGGGVDAQELAQLVLSGGDERSRRRIAQEYYRAEAAQPQAA